MIDAKRNAPAVNGGESGTYEGHQPNALSLVPSAADFPEQIPLTDRTDRRLEQIADGLILGVVSPRQFVGGLAALYWAAHSGEAWAEANRLGSRVVRLERECDRLHFLAFNPGKNGGHWLNWQTDLLWREGAA